MVAVSLFCTATAYAQHDKLAGIFSVTTCPAENCENAINISWATDTSVKRAVVEITPAGDSEWKKSSFHLFEGRLCTTFDSVYSKGPKGENFYEDAVINKYNASIAGLKEGYPLQIQGISIVVQQCVRWCCRWRELCRLF